LYRDILAVFHYRNTGTGNHGLRRRKDGEVKLVSQYALEWRWRRLVSTGVKMEKACLYWSEDGECLSLLE